MSRQVSGFGRLLTMSITLAFSTGVICSAQGTIATDAKSRVTVHPAGAVNGANLIFTLPEEPAEGSDVRVVVGGRELKPIHEFTANGREITLAHSVAPSAGTSLTVSYQGAGNTVRPGPPPSPDEQTLRSISQQARIESLLEEAKQVPHSPGIRSTQRPEPYPQSLGHSERATFSDLLQRRINSYDEASGRRGERRLSGFEGFGSIGGLGGRSLRSRDDSVGRKAPASDSGSQSRAFAMMQRRIDTANDTAVSPKKERR